MTDSSFFLEVSSSEKFQWILLIVCTYVTDILNLCLKKFDAEKKKNKWTKWQSFEVRHFPTSAHVQ